MERRKTLTRLLVVALAILPLRAAESQAASSVAEVQGLMQRLTDAVNRQDGKLMTSVYVLEDPLVFSSHATFVTRRDSLHAIYLAWDPTRGSWTGVFERRKGRWGLAHEHESFRR